ncbi:MAG: hypothetical protein ACI9G1_003828 [Pirellulaceae bacterium]|jgi:hypothetical protein
MFRDLTAWIECGEIDNCQINMVFGYLCLKGMSRPLRLHLTGRASNDLRGKRHRFCVAKLKRRRFKKNAPAPVLDIQQIGPAYDIRYDTDGFRLEWSGQNGPWVIAIPAVHVNVWEEEYEPSCFPAETALQCGEVIHEPTCNDTDCNEPSDAVAQNVQMPIGELLSPLNEVYVRSLVDFEMVARPESIAAVDLQNSCLFLLAELAKFGISITVCDHYNERDVYEFIWYVVLEEKTNPKLLEAGYIEHWMTHDYCDACVE